MRGQMNAREEYTAGRPEAVRPPLQSVSVRTTLPWWRRAGIHGGIRAAGLAAAVFVVTVGVLGLRLSTKFVLPGQGDFWQTDFSHWGMMDFRDNVHHPVSAFLAGENPYEAPRRRREDPTVPPFGPYAPSTLIVHLPFGFVHFETAAVVWFVLTLALMLVLAGLTLTYAGLPVTAVGVIALGTLLLWSKPGYTNLLLGQLGAELSVATAVALIWARRRPALAGAALGFTMLKPSLGVPLAIMLLARRNLRALLAGVAVAIVLNGLAVTVLLKEAGGVQPFVASVHETLDAFRDNPGNRPSRSIARLDLTALIAHHLGYAPGPLVTGGVAVGVLGVAALALDRLARRRRDAEAAEQIGLVVAVLATLLWFYTNGYDGLRLAVPFVAVAVGRRRPWATAPRLRVALGTLLAVPLANYLASGTSIAALGLGRAAQLCVASLNGLALTAAFAIVVMLAFQPETSDGGAAH